MSVAVMISTHDRLDDARGNMEIVRGWQAEFDQPVPIVHAYNGPGPWTPYLEDLLVEVPPSPSHFAGAADLIDAGLEAIARVYPKVQYVVCVAADTWWYRPDQVRRVVEEMRAGQLRLAAASWEVADDAHGVRRQRGDPELLPGKGLSTDCFVVDLPWARESGMLPLDFEGFLTRNGEMLNYLQEIVLLEKHLEGRFLAAVRAQLRSEHWPKDSWGSEGLRRGRDRLRLMDERPIPPRGHKGHWPAFGLITIEDPARKQTELRAVDGLPDGPVLQRLLCEPDTTWFNRPLVS